MHLVAKAVWSWRRLPVRACALTRAVLATFSLGDTLLAGGHEHAAVKLLWSWPQSLPLLSAVLPARFSVLADGAAGALLAFCADAAGPALSAAEVPQSYIRAMTVPQTRMCAQIAAWRVAAVVAVTDRDSVLRCYLIDLLGPPCQVIGDVLAWRTQHRR